ncbi:Os02g0736800 [Oryza sativa Japonica Group]|uniref:Os02g0736800 protein n=5 Tax=Oryza TaxID=4527 RepID=Q0DXR7_ORYSJ|nr:hypothetical protein OsI_08854 [Oryza sativa Indica Group]KAB8088813.1 hypothetical protein EE612_013539 [Oryza sativa]KAF2946856.1 hypothetical protein DAI22_02g325700 [Oryza sativa Japonica Group]BAF09971.1 Os02g0736800 [Oryza sativa Japonica Group]BAS80812.1 Os02g0736800 [Oryza sativa Japonica Group]|eukprot:NP_001048057.1 Os02g0736800 [Oryza sativa Japonica Group]
MMSARLRLNFFGGGFRRWKLASSHRPCGAMAVAHGRGKSSTGPSDLRLNRSRRRLSAALAIKFIIFSSSSCTVGRRKHLQEQCVWPCVEVGENRIQ